MRSWIIFLGLLFKSVECYKVTVFSRSGRTRKLKPQTYLLVEENGNLFVNTGYRDRKSVV